MYKKMRPVVLATMAALFCFSALSQKDYVDPNQREKRGLLEEPLEEAPEPAPEPAPVKNKVSNDLSPEKKRLCQCDKLSVLLTKTYKRYYHEGYKLNALNYDYSTYYRIKKEADKAKKVTNILRNKHDLEDFSCPYIEIPEVKYKDLKKAVKKQRKSCDLDVLGR